VLLNLLSAIMAVNAPKETLVHSRLGYPKQAGSGLMDLQNGSTMGQIESNFASTRAVGRASRTHKNGAVSFKEKWANIYFAGRLIHSKVTAKAGQEGSPVITDRLGSVLRGGANAGEKATYYPYGEQRTPGMNVSNQTAFATYQRDVGYGGTLDYALNRYYAAQWGRFTTPDPYQASAQLANPQSWNRYSYVENDPITYWSEPRK
jgi:RHS repeat-associated protein